MGCSFTESIRIRKCSLYFSKTNLHRSYTGMDRHLSLTSSYSCTVVHSIDTNMGLYESENNTICTHVETFRFIFLDKKETPPHVINPSNLWYWCWRLRCHSSYVVHSKCFVYIYTVSSTRILNENVLPLRHLFGFCICFNMAN